MSATEAYDQAFYETIAGGCRRSAAAVVPLVLGHLSEVRRVIDVGCGEGHWAAAFDEHGCEVLGLDGEYVDSPLVPLEVADLEQPITLEETFDLAVSLEVAEHLRPERADGFIEDLCKLAPVVLFSAAIPGQGGAGHLNEQWPAYWVERFEANGYACSGALRWAIWEDESVENWYRQNLIVAARDPKALPGLFATPLAPIWPVVHPVLYGARR